jgi:hypothetical protein
MKSTKLDQIASIILKYLLHLLSIALFYFAMLYTTTSFWLHALLDKFTRVYYVPVPNFHDQVVHLLIIYSLFCYFANNFILDLYHRDKIKPLIYSVIADMLVLPLGITLTIIYNNITIKSKVADTTLLYNIYVITALLIIKEIIAMKLVSKKNGNSKKAVLNTR